MAKAGSRTTRADRLPLTGRTRLLEDPRARRATHKEAVRFTSARPPTPVRGASGPVETRARHLDDSMADLLSFVEGLQGLSPRRLCDEVLDWRLTAVRQEDDMCLLAVCLA